MKANAWRKYLDQQRDRHRKTLYTVTELANVAGTSRAAVNVELSRLRAQEIIVKYAHGLYGLPGAVAPEALVAAVDTHAYLTGHYALFRHHLVTQIPIVLTCFTDRPKARSRRRETPLGRLDFVCVRSRVYCPRLAGTLAPPPEALCDYVYLCRRQGIWPESMVTFRHLARLRDVDLAPVLARYPASVREHVERLLRE